MAVLSILLFMIITVQLVTFIPPTSCSPFDRQLCVYIYWNGVQKNWNVLGMVKINGLCPNIDTIKLVISKFILTHSMSIFPCYLS